MSLTSQLTEQHARIVALKASETELLEGPDAALLVIGPPTDPIRMRAALSILARAGRHSLAGDLIASQRIDDKWIDMAVLVFASLGKTDLALPLIERTDNSSDSSLMRSSRLAFAEGVIERWRQQRPGCSLLAPYDWPAADVDMARLVVEMLDPLLSSIRGNRRIDSEFELGATIYACYCCIIAADSHVLRQCVAWLLKHVPVPLLVAEMCLRGHIPDVPASLPTRLRVEHANEFQASMLAAVIEREIFSRHQEAFDALLQLSSRATTDGEKEAVCVALFETCGRCKPDAIEKAYGIVTTLRPDDLRLLGFLAAFKSLYMGHIAEARTQLEAVRDEGDGVWWQAYAQLCEKAGEEEAAQVAWEQASNLLPHPDVVRRSARAAIDRRKYQSAVRELNRLLERDPTNEHTLRTLAWTLAQLNDHSQAAIYLQRLTAIAPSNAQYSMWLAQALARTARISEAIRVLQPVCANEDASLESLLFLSELLGADNKSGDAFSLLEQVAADHWDDPRFLMIYMHAGHAAGQDRRASEAFARLLELRQEGKVPPELLQERTLEQLVEHGRAYQTRRESLQNAVIVGQMPWLYAADALGHPPVWAWALHTQGLAWLSEEPHSRAAFSIYATNGFTVQSAGAERRLERVAASKKGAPVVADLSALLTLHKLGRLEKVASHFGYLVLPASYGDLRIRDGHRFSQHQPSREEELSKIHSFIDAGRIHVLEGGTSPLDSVDEYTDDPSKHAYRLRDLIPHLKSTQSASASAIEELQRVAHKPSGIDEDHQGIALGAKIVVDLATLRTLALQAAFEPLVSRFVVCIRSTQHEDIKAEIRAHAEARAAKHSHDALWQSVADLVADQKVRWQPTPRTSTDDDSGNVVFLDALKVAQDLHLPFLVDDRVLAVVFFNATSGTELPAFDSSCALESLRAEGSCTATEVARDYQLLMGWRYRFLIPSADVLCAWAEQSLSTPPGSALLDAAVYLHDSLRDPGLLCGLEQSDPPTPIAAKVVTEWFTSIAVFLARIWSNLDASEECCVRLTQWAGEEFLPSCPRGLWYHPIGHNIAEASHSSLFGIFMVQLTSVMDQRRANLALVTLAEAIGLDDNRYFTAVADCIRACLGKTHVHASDDAGRTFAQRLMQNALFHVAESGLDALTVSRFMDLGLLRGAIPPTLPESLAQSLSLADSSQESMPPKGPLLFVRDGETASVLDIDNILLHPDGKLRRAGLEYVETGDAGHPPWLSPRTMDSARALGSDIRSEDEKQWRPAANDLAALVRDDFLAHVAALRQSFFYNYQDGINQYIRLVMHPRLNSVLFLRPPLWSCSEQREEVDAWITHASQLPSIEDALAYYMERCGYIPLRHNASASALLKRWCECHPDDPVSWKRLWSWAANTGSPLSKYHAVTMALYHSAVRPSGSMEELWKEAGNILMVSESADKSSQKDRGWELYCNVASHFTRHIEGLHPAQDGERVACYAWWLTAVVCEIFQKNETIVCIFLDRFLVREAQMSYLRWGSARSPSAPSPLRGATLHVSSAWAMSLLATISCVARTSLQGGVDESMQQELGTALHGYLLTCGIVDHYESSAVTLSFQENQHIEDLCAVDGFVPQADREALAELVALRRQFGDPHELEKALEQWTELPAGVQQLLVLSIKSSIYSTTRFDDQIVKILQDTTRLVTMLSEVPEYVLSSCLEVLEEFQQHQVANWPVRLPHLLSHVAELTKDPGRRKLISMHVLRMASNSGALSSIQRLVGSRMLPDWASVLSTWRENLVGIAKRSEPWIGARARGVSSMVSRLIGPRQVEHKPEQVIDNTSKTSL